MVAQTVENLPAVQETWVWFLGQEDPLEKEIAAHSSILAWRFPWTKEPSGLQSMGSRRVGHDWANFTFIGLVSGQCGSDFLFFFKWFNCELRGSGLQSMRAHLCTQIISPLLDGVLDGLPGQHILICPTLVLWSQVGHFSAQHIESVACASCNCPFF